MSETRIDPSCVGDQKLICTLWTKTTYDHGGGIAGFVTQDLMGPCMDKDKGSKIIDKGGKSAGGFFPL